jgi:PhnB protein
MRINAYLSFPGTCREAFEFYASCLEGKITDMLTHEGMPTGMPLPAGWGDKILHVQLVAGDNILMGSDTPPDYYQAPAGFHVSISVDNAAAAEVAFGRLAAGGQIRMPLEETFWAVRFGMLVDRYGVPWMINCEKIG